MMRKTALWACLAAGFFLRGVAAQTLATGDARTVTEPAFPPVCATLASQTAIVNGAPASETVFDTARIQAALNTCGTGKAVELASSGSNYAFLIAPINIPSGVSLIVDGGVTVFGTRNREDYQASPVSSKVDECGTQGPNGNGCKVLISFGGGSTNVNSGIYGYGVIDARGYATTFKAGVDSGVSWWNNSDVLASGYSQNNPYILQATKSTNFTLYKITFRNAPEFHVKWSGTGFTAWGVKIITPFTPHNTDGIDPDGVNITIRDSSISDGDDNIAIGAGSIPSANVTVSHVNTYSGHGVSVGSYTSGGLTNFLVSDVNMAGTATDKNATGIRLKSAADRGGLVQTVTYQNMCLKDMREILYFDPFYDTGTGTLIPSFQNIVLQNVHFLTTSSPVYPYVVKLQGHDANHASTITLNNVVFDVLSNSNVSSPQYETFTLKGNVYPAVLQNLSGPGVSYTGSATALAGAGVSSCANVFPYVVGELYLSGASATNLQTATVASTDAVVLHAMVQPAMSQVAFSGSTGTWTGAAALTQPIHFYEGNTPVGSAALSANGTLASLSLSGLSAGTHTYTAQYPGDSNYQELNFGSVTVTVTGPTVATTTALTMPASVTYGTTANLLATVAAASGTPSGIVRFYDGSTQLGTVTLASGQASLSYLFTGGTHSLSAVYEGDSTFVGSSSAPSGLAVNPASVSAALAVAPSPVAVQGATALTATLGGVPGGQPPSGTVYFTDGATPMGSASLVSGMATLSTAFSLAGPHSITASYAGDINYLSATANASVLVTTSTSVTLSVPSSAVYGGGIALSATVSATGGTASGNVSFYDGTTLLQAAQPLVNGSASLTNVILSGGVHPITAVFSGNTTYLPSTSAASSVTISAASTTTVLAAQPPTVAGNATVSLTATVAGIAGLAAPSGTVRFSEGNTLLGSANLVGGVATWPASFSSLGSRTISAVYSGDANYAGSTGTAAENVTAIATSLVLALSSPVAYPGAATTLTATLTPAQSGAAITFFNGTAVLGAATTNAAGVASFTFQAGGAGSYTFTSSFGASGLYGASSSSAQTLAVGYAVAVTATPNPISVAPGHSGTVTLSISPIDAYSGPVVLACSSPVTYVTCSPAPATVTVAGSNVTASLTILVASTVASRRSLEEPLMAVLLPAGLLAFLHRRRGLTAFGPLTTILVAGALCGLAGCGAGIKAPQPIVPSGAQNVTLSVSAANLTQTTTITVTLP